MSDAEKAARVAAFLAKIKGTLVINAYGARGPAKLQVSDLEAAMARLAELEQWHAASTEEEEFRG